MIEINNRYTQMQLNQYNAEANQWSEENRDKVVGSFDLHNQWNDYEILFERIENTKDKLAIDFGCGPGRNLVRYKNTFKRLDGVDISPVNIEKAKLYCFRNGIINNNLYVNNGIDLQIIESEQYDVVMSTITLQHICVYDIRKSLFKEFHRILKDGGVFTSQMGYGPLTPQKNSVDYYDNCYDAFASNGECDTRVEDPTQIKSDLEEIGFSDFNFKITTTGPGDAHPNWIFFSAIK
jgi:ubiquinone/menaquinone biosynthesis C-methylase UbiE